MSGLSNMMKEGWHPKAKDGKSKESWRGDFKGINQVAGWMGKGKDPSSDQSEHVAQPLSSLKDPSAFAPPPKHINYHGAAALPNETTPDRRGLGAPLSHEQVEQQQYIQQQQAAEEEEAAQKPKGPPVPYRVNTTGLTTDNLPPPPVRRMDSPSSSTASTGRQNPPIPAKPSGAKPKPQLPPRLPPRNGSPAQDPSPPPPAYSSVPPSPSQGYINQGAASRLANAGVSVPAFGIGGATGTSQASPAASEKPVNELQSRFSQLRTDSNTSSKASQPYVPAPRPMNSDDHLPPAQGFRDRHADKIDFGKKTLGGVTSRINTFVDDRKFSANANKRMPRPPGPNSPATNPPTPSRSSTSTSLEAQARMKPPPPPPKRAEIRAAPIANSGDASPESSSPAPPPVPLSTKPR
ncbi:hypothetical protein N7478_002288 [Penicillium angulare]|uniref:uncharacterized protein n=1 Tax=Penicillium angulare TaxID=116970 RepID=UPI002540D455|nr:uncharacterized protein N7478_002288 [Penicillium angulare]KAJ5286602.1 hypothetical protein N7478_002288 [Penicillium angulare]